MGRRSSWVNKGLEYLELKTNKQNAFSPSVASHEDEDVRSFLMQRIPVAQRNPSVLPLSSLHNFAFFFSIVFITTSYTVYLLRASSSMKINLERQEFFPFVIEKLLHLEQCLLLRYSINICCVSKLVNLF
jgi:hypothetical protein